MQLAALALAGSPGYYLGCLCIFGKLVPCLILTASSIVTYVCPVGVCCHRFGNALACHKLKDICKDGTLSVGLLGAPSAAEACPLSLLQMHALSGDFVL